MNDSPEPDSRGFLEEFQELAGRDPTSLKDLGEFIDALRRAAEPPPRFDQAAIWRVVERSLKEAEENPPPA